MIEGARPTYLSGDSSLPTLHLLVMPPGLPLAVILSLS